MSVNDTFPLGTCFAHKMPYGAHQNSIISCRDARLGRCLFYMLLFKTLLFTFVFESLQGCAIYSIHKRIHTHTHTET